MELKGILVLYLLGRQLRMVRIRSMELKGDTMGYPTRAPIGAYNKHLLMRSRGKLKVTFGKLNGLTLHVWSPQLLLGRRI